jgi:hypothetical protein
MAGHTGFIVYFFVSGPGMKDLFVLTADSDSQAVMRTVLVRPRDLGIRQITAEIRRFPGRDSGMVKDGPEIARAMVKKSDYSRLILIWDHHGSGWHDRAPEDAVSRIQQRLDSSTWTDRSAAIVVVPEIEEWLWHCPQSIAGHFDISVDKLNALVTQLSTKLSRSRDRCCRELPKELFERVLYERKRRGPLPEDFESLAASANLNSWRASETFARLATVLEEWFPAEQTAR